MIYQGDFFETVSVLPEGNIPGIPKSNIQVWNEVLLKYTIVFAGTFSKGKYQPFQHLVIILFFIRQVPNLNCGLFSVANCQHQEFGSMPWQQCWAVAMKTMQWKNYAILKILDLRYVNQSYHGNLLVF